MDDVIYYIIAGIAWFVFSAIKASKKKQNAKPLPLPEQEYDDSEEQTDFKDIFIDLEEEVEKRNESNTQNYETVEAKYSNRLDKIPADYFEKNRSEGVSAFVNKGKKIDIKKKKEKKLNFNFRKAIIYQAIMERPYK